MNLIIKQGFWLEGSFSKRKKAGTEIGIILVVFSIFFWIIVPMIGYILEGKSALIYKEQAIISVELAVIDLITTLDPSALSENDMRWPMNLEEKFEYFFSEKMIPDACLKNLKINMLTPHIMGIEFILPYHGKFFTGDYEIPIAFEYEFPQNR